jgi:HlyD family secretion protein
MNSRVKKAVLIIALIGVAILAGWIYYQVKPDAWQSFLAEMQGETSPSPGPAPRPIVQASRRRGNLMASGTIEATQIDLAAEIGGRVVEVASAEGDQVDAGELMLQLDQRTLLAQRQEMESRVAQAKAALAAAQAELNKAEVGATPEEIAAAQAAVAAAEGSLAAAEAALTQAEINAQSARTVEESESSVTIAEADVAKAEGVVAASEADLDRAQAELSRLQEGTRPEEIAMYQALVNQAESDFLFYRNIHDDSFISKDIGGAPEERARYQQESARGAWDAAKARLALAEAGTAPADIAAARAAVRAAEAQVTITEAGVTGAEAHLAQTKAQPEVTQDQVALADAGVEAAEAQVAIATGRLAQAEAELARLKAGVTNEEIAVLDAQVAEAQAAIEAAEAGLVAVQLQLEQATIMAPTSGIVLESLIHPGELAVPGAPLYKLADLDEVTLTVYVPEADLGDVSLGEPVEVSVDAYDQIFEGQVTYIASEAEFTPKNVQTQEERVHMVFAVKIRLSNPDHLLKPGMPADATFIPAG